jgi:hypothetical protein
MKQTIALKDTKLRKEINGKFNNISSADKNKYKSMTAAVSPSVRS